MRAFEAVTPSFYQHHGAHVNPMEVCAMNSPDLYPAIDAARQTEREEAKAIHQFREHLAAADSPEQALEILLQTLDTYCNEIRDYTKAMCGVDLWTGQGLRSRLSDRQKRIVDETSKCFNLLCDLLNSGLQLQQKVHPELACEMIFQQMERQPKRISIRTWQAAGVPGDIRKNAQIHIAAYVEQMLQPHSKKGTTETINANLQRFLNAAGREGLRDAAMLAIGEPLETAEPKDCINAAARIIRAENGEKVHLKRVPDEDGENLLEAQPDTSDAANTEEAATRKIEYADAVKQLNKLKPIYRDALWLDCQGLTVEQSAQKQGVSFETAKKRLYRANQELERLRKKV